MAKKEALRDLQQRLAERLQQAKSTDTPAAWLAVEAAGRGFLLPLGEAGEIFPVGSMTPVPHTSPWFAGIASLRGNLHGVVDLARFVGLSGARSMAPGDALRDRARLVSFNPALHVNSALLVDQLAGLRRADQMAKAADDAPLARPPFVGARYRDASGREWQELKLRQLAVDSHFLRIGA